MSKRINLLVVVALVSSFVLAQTTEGEGIHPYKPVSNPTTETGHWSLWIEGGFNSFDGDFTSELKNAISAPTVGIALEYNFTPTWGLGGQYLYSMYNAKGKEGLPEYLLKGQMHRADAFLSFDLVNAWFPTEVSKIVSLNILAGGGVAYIRAQAALEGLKGENEDEQTGIEIIRRAIEEPLRQIVANAGKEGAVVVDKVRQGEADFGYNARKDVYENLKAAGVVDPAKVTRVALENAASIAGMFLTTECVITDIKEEHPAPAMPAGGMGGMM